MTRAAASAGPLRRGEGRANEWWRALIALGLRAFGGAAALRQRRALDRFPAAQRRLRCRYGITADTPLTRELPALPESLGEPVPVPVALTSGTSGSPRAVAYPPGRVARVRRVFIEAMARLIAAEGIRRTGFYAFGAFDSDRSLGSLLTAEAGIPSRLALLQAPYRAHAASSLRALAGEYGVPAARLLVLAVSNPGILYATNPSTLSVFFDDLEADWERVRSLARAVAADRPRPGTPAGPLLRKVAAPGLFDRLERVAASPDPLPITDWAPAVSHLVCWSSGAAAPFLEAVDRHLPPPRFRRWPMFSMSTETLETVPEYRDGDRALLPAAPGVFYEFLDAEGPETEAALLLPAALQPGRDYEMVVSHEFGLRRYRTGDLFRVERRFHGHPDLCFRRRRGVSWSFTGEKLTAAQVDAALERILADEAETRARFWLALFPEERGRGAVPGYLLAAVPRAGGRGPALPGGLAARLDEALSTLNLEYRAKRESGRLAPVRLAAVERAEFVRRAAGGGAASLDSQFKFASFYPRLWDD